MTPAAIQALVYSGLTTGDNQAACEAKARELVTQRRKCLEGTGWDLSYHAGTACPPQGAILIGAVTCRVEGECDINLYVYPVRPEAMLLRDRCCVYPTPTPIPTPIATTTASSADIYRYQLQNCQQDEGWEDVAGEQYADVTIAIRRGRELAGNAMVYGMVRVLDVGNDKYRVIITFSAGGSLAP